MYFSEFYPDLCRLAAPRHHVCAHPHADARACTPMNLRALDRLNRKLIADDAHDDDAARCRQ